MENNEIYCNSLISKQIIILYDYYKIIVKFLYFPTSSEISLSVLWVYILAEIVIIHKIVPCKIILYFSTTKPKFEIIGYIFIFKNSIVPSTRIIPDEFEKKITGLGIITDSTGEWEDYNIVILLVSILERTWSAATPVTSDQEKRFFSFKLSTGTCCQVKKIFSFQKLSIPRNQDSNITIDD
ncbi:hypothetical protein QTP88_005192 [Uroleucon formosanum]